MPKPKEGSDGENSIGKTVSNYSTVPLVNIVYNSFGIPDNQRLAATKYVESLIAQGVKPNWILEHINSERAYAGHDAVSQSRALLKALENVRHNLKEIEQASKETRSDIKRI